MARSEKSKPDVTPGSQRRWSREPVESPIVHVNLVDYAKTLLKNSESRHSKNRARERIYEGQELLNNKAAVVSLEAAGIGIARLNATKSIIDTWASRLAKDRPMPQFNVEDDWTRKRQAKKFRQFTVGKMRETQFDELSREALLDSGIVGDGFTRIDNDGDVDIFAEKIPQNELLFDARECKYGKPQQAVRIYRMAKDYLAELYPDHAEQIRMAPASVRRKDDDDNDVISDLEDYMDVYEAWALPATKECPGRHFIGGENVTFVFEEWLEPRFPWGHMRVFKPRRGLHGTGFVDQLASLQHRVNCIVRDLQLNIAATGRGHFLVNENNDIPVEMLTGWQPFKLKFKGGTPPTYVAPQPFNPAQLEALEYFISKMYDLSGVSQANATSKSALGAGASGAALDTQYDIDSDRFRLPQSNYAQYRLDCAQRYVDAAARVARRRSKHKDEKRKAYVVVSWNARDAIEKLEYDKVALQEGQYCLQIEAVNFIPDTRAGKMSVVEQLAKAGVIPQWLVPTLFDEPDIVAANGIILAPFRAAIKKMEEILPDPDEPMPTPAAHNDLELELKLVVAYLNRLEEEKNVPLEIFERFDTYHKLVLHEISIKSSAAPMLDGAINPAMGIGTPPMAPPLPPMPGGVPAMPTGPVPAPTPIGAPLPPMPA